MAQKGGGPGGGPPAGIEGKMLSYLDLVKACDNFPHPDLPSALAAGYTPLYLPADPRPHGLLHPTTITRMPWTPTFSITPSAITLTCAPTGAACSHAFQTLIDAAIDTDAFPEVLNGQHSELFPILGARTSDGEPVLLERFAGDLFGITARGAHMTVFTRTGADLKIWVPRRSARSFTFPNMLDSTVAGGVAAHQTPWQNIVAEADEEASLSASLLERGAKAAGALTYVGMNGSGSVAPDVVYVYDLEVGAEVVPRVNDGEVEEFLLMGVEEVRGSLRRGEWKTNSAVVMVDFLVRHGIVTAEEVGEGELVAIVQGLHRTLPFPVGRDEGWT